MVIFILKSLCKDHRYQHNHNHHNHQGHLQVTLAAASCQLSPRASVCWLVLCSLEVLLIASTFLNLHMYDQMHFQLWFIISYFKGSLNISKEVKPNQPTYFKFFDFGHFLIFWTVWTLLLFYGYIRQIWTFWTVLHIFRQF